MRVLAVPDIVGHLECPACGAAPLCLGEASSGTVLSCPRCERTFLCRGDVIELVAPELLDETARNEVAGNEVDLRDERAIRHMVEKENWSRLRTYMLMKGIRAVQRVISDYPWETTVVSLGSGAGFELKMLLRRWRFRRILSSDISLSRVSIVPTALSEFDVELGLFTCDFGSCPVRKSPGHLGLVFQALHHTSDIHAALERLLVRNFTDLVIVEPT